jgi:hypothetical protein
MRVWQGARVGSTLSGQEEESATSAERKVGTTTGQQATGLRRPSQLLPPLLCHLPRVEKSLLVR